MSAVQLLRDLANQLEAGHLTGDKMLIPVPARDIKVGDRISDRVGYYLTVSEIEVRNIRQSDGVTPLLALKGRYTTPDMPDGFDSSVTAWADDWVVAER